MTNQPSDPYNSQGQPNPKDVRVSVGFLRDIVNEVRLTWRLLRDPRIPWWLKLIPPGALIYVISPVDFIPDPIIGLGQLDDLAALIFGLRMFVEMSPPAIVHEHRMAIAAESGAVPPATPGTPPGGQGPVIDGSWKTMDPKDPRNP